MYCLSLHTSLLYMLKVYIIFIDNNSINEVNTNHEVINNIYVVGSDPRK